MAIAFQVASNSFPGCDLVQADVASDPGCELVVRITHLSCCANEVGTLVRISTHPRIQEAVTSFTLSIGPAGAARADPVCPP